MPDLELLTLLFGIPLAWANWRIECDPVSRNTENFLATRSEIHPYRPLAVVEETQS